MRTLRSQEHWPAAPVFGASQLTGTVKESCKLDKITICPYWRLHYWSHLNLARQKAPGPFAVGDKPPRSGQGGNDLMGSASSVLRQAGLCAVVRCCESLRPNYAPTRGALRIWRMKRGGGGGQNLTLTSPLSKAWAIFPRNSIVKISRKGRVQAAGPIREGQEGCAPV